MEAEAKYRAAFELIDHERKQLRAEREEFAHDIGQLAFAVQVAACPSECRPASLSTSRSIHALRP